MWLIVLKISNCDHYLCYCKNVSICDITTHQILGHLIIMTFRIHGKNVTILTTLWMHWDPLRKLRQGILFLSMSTGVEFLPEFQSCCVHINVPMAMGWRGRQANFSGTCISSQKLEYYDLWVQHLMCQWIVLNLLYCTLMYICEFLVSEWYVLMIWCFI